MTLFRSFQRLFARALLPVLALLQSGLNAFASVWATQNLGSGAFASGGLPLNGTVSLTAPVIAPGGTVTLSGNSTLHGTVKADRLIVNGDALLKNP